MAWLQLQIKASPKTAETVSDLMLNLGAGAVTLLDAKNQPLLEPGPGETPLWDEAWVSALLKEESDVTLLLSRLKTLLADDHLEYRLVPLEDKNWTREWLQYFRPMQFGKKLWVTPEEHRAEITDKNAIIVVLDPGLAFGTGTHPTTALCLEWLEQNIKAGDTVIDYGCGSGILAIAALKLGAAKVYAVDNDPQALTATLENAKRNSIKPTQLIARHADGFNSPEADVLIANILSKPLIALAATFSRLVKSSGLVALSGILTGQIEEVQHAYTHSFDLNIPKLQEEWVLISGKKICC